MQDIAGHGAAVERVKVQVLDTALQQIITKFSSKRRRQKGLGAVPHCVAEAISDDLRDMGATLRSKPLHTVPVFYW